ncbi:MAG: ACT domain-containing protein [Ruminococcus sp.]|nr:ACT domain-containing protein [Ruminococcus sp.]
MEPQPQFIVVDSAVLPEVFKKVLEVKKLVAEHSEKSFASACKKVDISRSAFYKYRDYVFTYEDKLTQRILNYVIVLCDKAGVLSSVLATLHDLHSNILTVNQNIPVDGVATASISIQCNGDNTAPGTITRAISALPGVVEVRLLSGE